MRTHGGEAAGIGTVTLQVRNSHARALRDPIDGIELLADHSCALPQQVSRRPTLASATPNALPPRDGTLEVRFARQEPYRAHGNRCARRVRLRLAGQLVAISSGHEVTRMEPFGE